MRGIQCIACLLHNNHVADEWNCIPSVNCVVCISDPSADVVFACVKLAPVIHAYSLEQRVGWVD